MSAPSAQAKSSRSSDLMIGLQGQEFDEFIEILQLFHPHRCTRHEFFSNIGHFASTDAPHATLNYKTHLVSLSPVVRYREPSQN